MRLFDYVLKYSKFISIFLHKAICNYKIKKNNKKIEKNVPSQFPYPEKYTNIKET